MTLKDLIIRIDKKAVEERMLHLYKDYTEYINGYMFVLERLQELEPQPNPQEKSIFITIDWVKPEEDYIDEKGYYHVHGIEPGVEIPWAIEYTPWKYWLGWKVNPDSLQKYGDTDFVCHCLWEMTWGGFTEAEVEASVIALLGREEDDV